MLEMSYHTESVAIVLPVVFLGEIQMLAQSRGGGGVAKSMLEQKSASQDSLLTLPLLTYEPQARNFILVRFSVPS